ncbi:MAG: hypothetical protein GX542_02700 [Rhodococcus sp.]|nr:hypothetical protein [Rhodococcus sp. (in: high G+C Gram-positive bacteria)]
MNQLEEAGAVLPEPGEHTTPLVARGYSHSVLGDRTVVRLVGESIVPAEDAMLDVLGLEPVSAAPVGHIRRRTIGFPAWPIIIDPANARYAIAAAADLQRARKLASTSANLAKEAISAAANTLAGSAPHFVPTFLEEAGRIFTDAESPTYAAQMFALAREAEAAHALPVDEDRHREAFLEFAFAGAVSVKALSAEARRLAASHDPQTAHEMLTTLVVRRIKGGLPPYTAMRKDLRRSAKAAGLDDAQQTRSLIAEIIDIPALANANAGFWREYRSAFVDAASANPEVADKLLAIAPSSVGLDDWLELLEQVGCPDRLRTPGYPAANWIQVICKRAATHRWGRTDDQTRLRALLDDPQIRENLTAGTEPVTLPLVAGARQLQPALIDTLIEIFGDRIVEVSARFQPDINFDLWWDHRETSGELRHLVGYEPLRTALIGGMRNFASGHCEQVVGGSYIVVSAEASAAILACPGTAYALKAYVAREVSALRSGDGLTAPEMVRIGDWLHYLARPELAEFLVDEFAALRQAIDPATLVEHNLRLGSVGELHWPNVTPQLVKVKGAPDKRAVHESWPLIGLSNKGSCEFYDRAGNVVAEFTHGHTTTSDGTHFVAVPVGEDPNDIDIASWWRNKHYQSDYAWSSAPTDVHSTEKGWYNSPEQMTLPVTGGRLVGAGALVQPGGSIEPLLSNEYRVLTDGSRVWGVTHSGGIVELDPETGAKVGTSWPTWLSAAAEQLDTQWTLSTGSVSMYVVDGVVAGSAAWYSGDYYDTRWKIATAAGTWHELPAGVAGQWYYPARVVTAPGGRDWLITRDGGVIDAQTTQTIVAANDGAACMPTWSWPLLTPVAPESGTALRGVTRLQAQKLVDAHASAPETLPTAVADFLGQPVDSAIVPVVTTLVANALKQGKRLSAMIDPPERMALARPNTNQEGVYDTSGASEALKRAVQLRWAGDLWGGARSIADISEAAGMLGLTSKISATHYRRDHRQWDTEHWPLLIGRFPALATIAAGPLAEDSERRALADVLQVFEDGGFGHAEVFARRLTKPKGVDAGLVADNEVIVVRTSGASYYSTVRAGWYSVGVGTPKALLDNATAEETVSGNRTGTTGLRAAVAATVGRSDEIVKLFDEADWEKFAAITNTSAGVGRILLGVGAARNRWGYDLDKDARAKLGVSTTDVRTAQTVLKDIDELAMLDILAAACPSDPAALSTTGLDVVAAAEALCRILGGPMPIGVDVLLAASNEIDAADAVATLVSDPERAGRALASTLESVNAWQHKQAIHSLYAALAWLCYRLPGDSPVRVNALAAAANIDEHVSTVGVSVMLGSVPPERVGHVFGLGEIGKTYSGRHGNIDIAAGHYYLDVSVRTAELTDHDIATLYSLMDPSGDYDHHRQLVESAVTFARAGLGQLADMLSTAPIAAGELRDPLVSAPEVVAEIAAAQGLSEDAARYYLQLLALPDPTDLQVKRWNSWTPARLKKAIAELESAELVVTGKRTRAGRSVFLPGGWIAYTKGSLPLERWKAPLYGLDPAPERPEPPLTMVLPQVDVATLFRQTWKRCVDGDVPGYADVAAVVGKKGTR